MSDPEWHAGLSTCTALQTELDQHYKLLATAGERIADQVENRRFRKMIEQLKLDGWDAQKSFDHPMSNCSRNEYIRRVNSYNFCRKYTKHTACCRSHKDPEIVTEKATAVEELKALGAKEAAAALESYVHKLSCKIDATVNAAEIQGIVYQGGADVWGWSHIIVKLTFGAQRVWRTKMIVADFLYGVSWAAVAFVSSGAAGEAANGLLDDIALWTAALTTNQVDRKSVV